MTIDNMQGLENRIYMAIQSIKDNPLEGKTRKIYDENMKIIIEGMKSGKNKIS